MNDGDGQSSGQLVSSFQFRQLLKLASLPGIVKLY